MLTASLVLWKSVLNPSKKKYDPKNWWKPVIKNYRSRKGEVLIIICQYTSKKAQYFVLSFLAKDLFKVDWKDKLTF